MPEGDTIYRAARALNQALAGRTVTGFETGLAKIARVNDDTPLAGRVIEKVEARGKWCLMYFSGDLILVTHMLMSGSWHLYRTGERWRMPRRAMRVMVRVGAVKMPDVVVDPTHAMKPHEWGTETAGREFVDPTHAMKPHEWGTGISGPEFVDPTHAMKPHEWGTGTAGREFVDPTPAMKPHEWGTGISGRKAQGDAVGWEAVAFNVPIAEFHTARSLERSSQVPKLGPDILSGEFTVDTGTARLEAYAREHPEAEVGVTLLNQRVLAGLGNVYKSEVAFSARVNPWRTMATVTRAEAERMVEFSLRYMKANVLDGSGDQIVTYSGNRRTTARMDKEERLWVYGRQGQECRRCGTIILSRKQGEQARSTFWCPECQP